MNCDERTQLNNDDRTHLPYSITTATLAEYLAQRKGLPPDLKSDTHLIYSSPATLAFNSPGAQGYGVKRAGLALPGSVMLLVSPSCCGRNTTILSELGGYNDRFFFLLLDENDIVTGKHLAKISEAVSAVVNSRSAAPSAVMICITCIDALLGTDMKLVCRRASEMVGLPVLPCYMYALTRDGRKPPMVAVRQSLYSLLAPRKKKSTSCNLLGHFAPLAEDCELYELLRSVGLKKICELATCRTMSDYYAMAEANFNLVLHHEARLAAEDMEKRLQIPSIELVRLYELDKIRSQYAGLGQVLGVSFNDAPYFEAAHASMSAFKGAHPDSVFSVGSVLSGNPFELALALARYGFRVAEIFATPGGEDAGYIKRLAQISPDTIIYSNLHPSMVHYSTRLAREAGVTVTLGADAAYYHPESPCLPWNAERQPWGYQMVRKLFDELSEVLK